jgi:hypothetical protein
LYHPQIDNLFKARSRVLTRRSRATPVQFRSLKNAPMFVATLGVGRGVDVDRHPVIATASGEIKYRAKSAEDKVRHPVFKGIREDL